MENLEKIVMLIDADNTQLSKLEDVMQEVSVHGRVVVKRAYGNWKKEAEKFAECIKAEKILISDAGHFNEKSGYKEFKQLLQYIK